MTQAVILGHQKAIWRFVRFLGASPQTANDLVQEAFLTLLQRPPRVADDAALGRWLRSVAHHRFVSVQRREAVGRRRVAELAFESADAVWQRCGGVTAGDAYLVALDHCRDLLGRREAELLRLRYREDLDRATIAGRLGLAEEGVKSLLRRVKDQLRDCIRRNVEDSDRCGGADDDRK